MKAAIRYGKHEVSFYRTHPTRGLLGGRVSIDVFGDNFMPAYTEGDTGLIIQGIKAQGNTPAKQLTEIKTFEFNNVGGAPKLITRTKTPGKSLTMRVARVTPLEITRAPSDPR